MMQTCGECGCDVDCSETLVLDDGTEVCDECYYDATHECVLCGDRFERMSEYLLCKAEFSTTGQRPPGIYRMKKRPFMTQPMLGEGWLHGTAVRFVDRLPKPDREWDLSGWVCNECAAPYARTHDRIYGNDTSWDREVEYTRSVILCNHDMLRDLECDRTSKDGDGKYLTYANANDWEDVRGTYRLPDGLPTFHEWVFVEHQGVRVFETCRGGTLCPWLSLRPEPRYRQGAGRLPETFAASGLPTHSREPHSYYLERPRAREAVIAAIELGLVRQDGLFDASGNSAWYG